jgi:hypothetical protein
MHEWRLEACVKRIDRARFAEEDKLLPHALPPPGSASEADIR